MTLVQGVILEGDIKLMSCTCATIVLSSHFRFTSFEYHTCKARLCRVISCTDINWGVLATSTVCINMGIMWNNSLRPILLLICYSNCLPVYYDDSNSQQLIIKTIKDTIYGNRCEWIYSFFISFGFVFVKTNIYSTSFNYCKFSEILQSHVDIYLSYISGLIKMFICQSKLRRSRKTLYILHPVILAWQLHFQATRKCESNQPKSM